jgi:ABC-type nitrate/sulfonate/bicarbonate transport system permease component
MLYFRTLLSTLAVMVVPLIFLALFSHFTRMSFSGLLADALASSVRLFIAYVIAALIAWTAGILFFRGKRAQTALPLFDVLQSFPTFAALPLATYFWGATNFTVIFFLVITVIWPILFSVIGSLKHARRDLEEAATIVGLRGILYLRYYLLPLSLTGLITGSIIGIGEGWEALIATEMIVNVQQGLGNFFSQYGQNVPVTMFGILGFLLFIFCLDKVIWLRLLDWSYEKIGE